MLTNLVPWHPDGFDVRSEGRLPEDEFDSPSPVHHEVELPTLAGESEAGVVGPEEGDPNPEESRTVGVQNFASHNGGSAAREGFSVTETSTATAFPYLAVLKTCIFILYNLQI